MSVFLQDTLANAGVYIGSNVPEVPVVDNVPDQFSFVDADSLPGLSVEASFTLSGMDVASTAAISVTGGEYSLDGGTTYTALAGIATAGQEIWHRMTSSAVVGETVTSTLMIGGVSASRSLTTIAPSVDDVPDQFSLIADINNADISTTHVSSFTVQGMDVGATAPISVTNGRYRINAGSWTSANSTVTQGDTVEHEVTASSQYSAGVTSTLSINGVSDSVTVTTTTEPDVNAPVISVPGYVDGQTINLTVGDTFTPPTVTAVDLEQGIITPVLIGIVDTSTEGTYSLTWTASDGTNQSTFTINVIVNPANSSPIVSNVIPNQNATVGVAYSLVIPIDTFSDEDGDAITYSIGLAGGVNLPSWLSFDPATRTLAGLARDYDVGTIALEVRGNDGNGGEATTNFNLEILPATGSTLVRNVRKNRHIAASHDGRLLQRVSEVFDADDQDSFWISFDKLLLTENIVSCEFILPDGWAILDFGFNQPIVTETSTTKNKTAWVKLSTSLRSGRHTIVARVTTDYGTQLDRGFFVVVSDDK